MVLDVFPPHLISIPNDSHFIEFSERFSTTDFICCIQISQILRFIESITSIGIQPTHLKNISNKSTTEEFCGILRRNIYSNLHQTNEIVFEYIFSSSEILNFFLHKIIGIFVDKYYICCPVNISIPIEWIRNTIYSKTRSVLSFFLPFFLSFSPAAPSSCLSYRSFLCPPVFTQKKKTCAFSSEKTHAFWHILMDLLYNLPLQNAYFFLRFCGFPIRLPAGVPSPISIRPAAGFVKFF